jgi:F0F1-type ATP synthase epsilon subunit
MIHIRVKTLDSTILDTHTSSVQLATKTGVIEIRPGHTPISGIIQTGVLSWIDTGNNTRDIITGSGVYSITSPDTVLIVCDGAEDTNQIDEEVTNQAIRSAKDLLDNLENSSTDPQEYRRIQSILELELTKLDYKRKNKR